MKEKISMFDRENCKVCDEPTSSVFNIGFTMVYICDECSNAIFLQQAIWLARKIVRDESGTKNS